MKQHVILTPYLILYFISLLPVLQACAMAPSSSTVDSLPRGGKGQREYTDIIYLSPTKNAYVDIKGTILLSADVGGDSRNIKIAVQENSSILKLKALRRGFEDANMIAVCKDTVLMYLLRFSENPEKTYYGYDFPAMRSRAQAARISEVVFSPKVEVPMSGASSVQVNAESAHRLDTTSQSPANTARHAYEPDDSLSRWMLDRLERIRAFKPNILIGDVAGGISIRLDRLYGDQANFYLSMTIENRTGVSYTIRNENFQVVNLSNSVGSLPAKFPYRESKNNIRVIQEGSTVHLAYAFSKIDLLPEEVLKFSITVKGWDQSSAKTLRLTITPDDLYRSRDWK